MGRRLVATLALAPLLFLVPAVGAGASPASVTAATVGTVSVVGSSNNYVWTLSGTLAGATSSGMPVAGSYQLEEQCLEFPFGGCTGTVTVADAIGTFSEPATITGNFVTQIASPAVTIEVSASAPTPLQGSFVATDIYPTNPLSPNEVIAVPQASTGTLTFSQ